MCPQIPEMQSGVRLVQQQQDQQPRLLERLNQELAEGKTGDNQPKLEIAGAFFGDVDREKGDDEPQSHHHGRPGQGSQDQFFPEDWTHREKS